MEGSPLSSLILSPKSSFMVSDELLSSVVLTAAISWSFLSSYYLSEP